MAKPNSKQFERTSRAVTRALAPSGYTPCGCRDCFEVAIGKSGALCHACAEAGCDGSAECQAPGAYAQDD